MTGLHLLWLPIVLSAVAVFVASSVLHMAGSWHKSDFRTVPDEGRVLDALRPFNIAPGDYLAPRPANMEDMRSPQFAEKMRKGPVLVVTVLPSGPPSMRRNLAMWFAYAVVIGVFAAYVAGRAVAPGGPYLHVFRFAGVTAFIGYAAALWQLSIWYRRSWSTTIKSTIDGLIYALLTAGIFGWLWPR